MVIVAMIVVVVMVIVIIVIIMVVVIIVVVMIIGTVGVNHSVEVFSLSINNRRSKGSFNCKHTVVGQSPFEDIAKLAINGIVLRLAIEVGFHASMTLNGDHWSDTKFTCRHLFTTTMSAVCMDPTDCSITGQQQGKGRGGIQKRKTRKDHQIKNSEIQKFRKKCKSISELRPNAPEAELLRFHHNVRPGQQRTCRCCQWLFGPDFCLEPGHLQTRT